MRRKPNPRGRSREKRRTVNIHVVSKRTKQHYPLISGQSTHLLTWNQELLAGSEQTTWCQLQALKGVLAPRQDKTLVDIFRAVLSMCRAICNNLDMRVSKLGGPYPPAKKERVVSLRYSFSISPTRVPSNRSIHIFTLCFLSRVAAEKSQGQRTSEGVPLGGPQFLRGIHMTLTSGMSQCEYAPEGDSLKGNRQWDVFFWGVPFLIPNEPRDSLKGNHMGWVFLGVIPFLIPC